MPGVCGPLRRHDSMPAFEAPVICSGVASLASRIDQRWAWPQAEQLSSDWSSGSPWNVEMSTRMPVDTSAFVIGHSMMIMKFIASTRIRYSANGPSHGTGDITRLAAFGLVTRTLRKRGQLMSIYDGSRDVCRMPVFTSPLAGQSDLGRELAGLAAVIAVGVAYLVFLKICGWRSPEHNSKSTDRRTQASPHAQDESVDGSEGANSQGG